MINLIGHAVPTRTLRLLSVGGIVLLVGGLIGSWIEHATIEAQNISSGPLPLMPVGRYTSYTSSPIHSSALNYHLMQDFNALAVVGVLFLFGAIAVFAWRAAHRDSRLSA
jgi:hypothetical protein